MTQPTAATPEPEVDHGLLDRVGRLIACYEGHRPPPDLSDRDALDLINYILSVPEWPSSFLEDIAAIVRSTGRTPFVLAEWGEL